MCLIVDLLQVTPDYFGVDLRGREVGMPKHFLNIPEFDIDGYTLFEEYTGDGE